MKHLYPLWFHAFTKLTLCDQCEFQFYQWAQTLQQIFFLENIKHQKMLTILKYFFLIDITILFGNPQIVL